MEDKPELDALPDMFAFGGYQLNDKQLSLLAPPAPPPAKSLSIIAKPERMVGLVKAANALVKPIVREEVKGGAKLALLELVVREIWEGLMREGCCRVDKVEYVSQLQHYPHHTHCDFLLAEMDKAPFVKVVAERFVKEFMKANARAEPMFFVVPQLQVPKAVFGRLFEFGGLVMRGMCDYQIQTDQYLVRFDCMWAVATKESLICQTNQAHQVIGMGSGGDQTRRG